MTIPAQYNIDNVRILSIVQTEIGECVALSDYNALVDELDQARAERDAALADAERMEDGWRNSNHDYMRLKEASSIDEIHVADLIGQRDMFAAQVNELNRVIDTLKLAAPTAAAPASLVQAAQAVADDVCSWLCPSVKKTGTEWTHVEKCVNLRAAIAQSLAVPAPEGWRLLEAGEYVIEGDEVYNPEEQAWLLLDYSVGEVMYEDDWPVRRRLPAAARQEG